MADVWAFLCKEGVSEEEYTRVKVVLHQLSHTGGKIQGIIHISACVHNYCQILLPLLNCIQSVCSFLQV
jgi:hypothetical protein